MFGVLALVALLVGCESEQTRTIKIGFIVAGERPTYLRSAQLAVDEINESGGLFGTPVELVSLENREASLPLSIQAAKDMILKDHVSASHRAQSVYACRSRGPNRTTVPCTDGDHCRQQPQRYGRR